MVEKYKPNLPLKLRRCFIKCGEMKIVPPLKRMGGRTKLGIAEVLRCKIQTYVAYGTKLSVYKPFF
ncbi:MAG: hypothetical protein PVH88_10530 [Ignavibacteria bacterium]|jgi:hypothetical protein